MVLHRGRNWCNFREWGKLNVMTSPVRPTSTLYTQHLLITGWDLHFPHHEHAHSQLPKCFSPYLYISHTDVTLFVSTSETFNLVYVHISFLLSACLSYKIALLAFLVLCRQLGDLLQPSIYLSVLDIFFFTFHLIFLFKHGVWLL